MKTTHLPKLLAVIATFLQFPATFLLAQGPLTPPGAPAPTMKTLDQVEARTIVNATNTPGNATNTFIITAPGSYYLTGNITGASGKHGISIQVDNVTLDLNGFAVISGGGGASLRGINFPNAQTNACIRNGTVRGWTDGGVRADTVRNVLAEKLTLSGNTASPGISVGLGSLVRDCLANANDVGFLTPDRCQIISCISTENTGNGFQVASYVAITDCTSSRNGAGIVTGGGFLITRCSITRNTSVGIGAFPSGTIADCTASDNGGSGISLFSDGNASSIIHCTANSNGGGGIFAAGSSVTHCSASGNGYDGIGAVNGVVAFCKANNNNKSSGGFADISAAGATRTGNNPAP